MAINMEDNIIKSLIMFYVCSFLGYLYELILNYIENGKIFSHGLLYGPWLPIYGTGALFIMLINKYKDNPYLIFVLSFFLTGILEYLCGLILLKIFKIRLWDYTGYLFNINGLVCFLSAFCFGIGGLIITYLIKPLIDKLFRIVDNNQIKLTLNILNILFLGDIIATTLK